MSVPAAYLSIILIWSTTLWPYSGVRLGRIPVSGNGRMAIGLAICVLLLAVFRIRMPWHRDARLTYLAAGWGYLARCCACIGARAIFHQA